MTDNEHRACGDNEGVLNLESSDDCTTVSILNTTEFYTFRVYCMVFRLYLNKAILLRNIKCPILFQIMVTWMYSYVKIYQATDLRIMQFM